MTAPRALPTMPPASAPRRLPNAVAWWMRRLLPRWSPDRCLARVVAQRVEAEGSTTLELAPNRRFQGFRPGQHVNLTAEVDGRRVTRSYTLTGVPGARRLSITAKAVPGGKLSGWLASEAARGRIVELSPAWGGMQAPEAGPRLLLAAGSGITPAIALLRAAAAAGTLDGVALGYWARRREELCFVDELRALAAAHPGLRIGFWLTGGDAGALAADEHAGRIDAAALAALAPQGTAGLDVLACGPRGFIEAAAALAGPDARVQAETFDPPALLDLAGAAGREVAITLASTGRTLRVAAGQPLLAALEAHGLTPKHGCRRGICNSCSCRKTAGTHADLLPGATGPDPEPATLRLCTSAALDDLTLAL